MATPSTTVSQNDVIRTKPAAGEKAAKGDTITVYFSSGPPNQMPKVIGMTLSDATAALGNAGVDPSRITVKRQRDDSCAVDTVIKSDPVPTSNLGSNTPITLWVCAGPSSKVPDVAAGSTVAEAQNTLQQAGYQTSQKSSYSASVPVGKVVGTDPASGTYYAAGQTVTILVSSGPQPTTVPPTTAAPTTAAPTTAAPTTAAPTTTASSSTTAAP